MTAAIPTGDLSGRAVVVTGAGGGLGRAYAHEAARAGARVVVNDLGADAAAVTAAEIGGDTVAIPGSVSDWESAEQLIRGCVAAFGRIDGLINNAGVLRGGLGWEMSERDMRAMVETNVLGSMFCGIHALRQMINQASGAILNVTSGAMLGMPQLSGYGATKGAIAALTWGWAVDTAGTGVRVNALSPVARTAMGDGWAMGDQSTGNHVAPDVIAPAAIYLISDRAAHLHGQVLRFNGRQLGFLTPPRAGGVSGARSAWSIDDVAHAVSRELADSLPEVGRAAALPSSLIPPMRH
jgi:NAD(P)-dependent dehydrogenase (short-subunit alcohol dehydrogenase family)